MKVLFSKEFLTLYKKAEVRIRHQVDQKVLIFTKSHLDLSLRNHPLKGKFLGKRSINITDDWRAIYEEMTGIEHEEPIAYFTSLGTHQELYQKSKKKKN